MGNMPQDGRDERERSSEYAAAAWECRDPTDDDQ